MLPKNILEINENNKTNFSFQEFDGFNLPFEPNSIDIAFSNQVLEHLHPDDALIQTQNILSILKKEGKYICITPNKLVGPNDVSRFFGFEYSGFHINEYTNFTLRKFLYSAGFRKVYMYCIVKGKKIKIPFVLICILELFVSFIPRRYREKFVSNRFVGILFNPIVVGVK